MHLFLFILVNILGSLLQGIVGIGQGLFATPLALTFLGKDEVMTAMIVAGVVLNGFLLFKVPVQKTKVRLWPLVLWGIIGLPIGVFILIMTPLDELKVAVGVLAVLLAAAVLYGKLHLAHRRWALPAASLLAGILQTSIGMPGAAIGVALAASGIPKDQMRRTLVTYFFVISLLTVPFYYLGGVLTLSGITLGLIAAPFIIVAGYYGNTIAKHVSPARYTRLAMAVVALSGAYAIFSGLR